MLNEVYQRVQAYQPRPLVGMQALPEAAVLLPLTRCENPELILTLRAQGLSTHAGEVAFPGGHREPADPDLVFTALRETQEEVGLAPDLVEVVGSLSTLVSRHGVMVTPYVGVVPDNVQLSVNADEIDSVFTVPLEFFASDPRHTTHRIDYLGRSWYVPSYTYADYKIWGLTAVMVVELVNIVYCRDICLSAPP